jgi:hypothetical protein
MDSSLGLFQCNRTRHARLDRITKSCGPFHPETAMAVPVGLCAAGPGLRVVRLRAGERAALIRGAAKSGTGRTAAADRRV